MAKWKNCGSGVLYRVCCLVFACLLSTGAWAQKPSNEMALGAVNAIYTIASMGQHVPPLETGQSLPTLYRALISPSLAKEAQSARPGYYPLTGHEDGTVAEFDLRMAQDQPAAGEEVIVEAAVKSGGKVRLISLAVTNSAAGKPVISRVWGNGWAFGGAMAAGSTTESITAPSVGEDGADMASENLSAEEQARLAAADEAQQVDLPSSDVLELPFEDDFEGRELADHWTVLNSNPNKFIVENSTIFNIASGGDEDFRHEEAENIFQLPAAPEGDFDMTVTGLLAPKTGYDGVWVGLYENAQSFVAANMYVYTKGCGPALYLRIVNRQPIEVMDDSLTSEFDTNLFDKGPMVGSICGDGGRARADAILKMLNETGFALTLSRRGTFYHARLEAEVPASENDPGGAVSVNSRKVARVTPAGKPAFELGQLSRAGSGETTAQFDRFVILPAAPQQK
jgi:hypothetical protein